MTTTRVNYRYPGARAFSDSTLDRRLFRGRETEQRALLHLVLTEPLVVVHGKSGTGKSSLVNAGLLEALRAQRYAPITVRLNDTERGPAARFVEAVDAAAKAHGWEVIGDRQATFRSFFSSVEIWSEDLLLTPVVIIDQFEELFTLHTPARRSDFIRDFAELIRGTEFHDGSRRPAMRAVLVIREDFLANLEELATELPTILNTRFHVGPLRRADAADAIKLPAGIENEDVVTRPFLYSEEAIEGVLDFLSGGRSHVHGDDDVEPFQLQLVCQYAETLVFERQEKRAEAIVITMQDLGGIAGLRRILSSFYEREIDHAGQGYLRKRRLYALFEEGLVNPEGRRLAVEETDIRRRFRVPVETVESLVKSRVLRPEPRRRSTWYELSHDTLVEPVLRSRQRRRARARRVFLGTAASLLLVAAAAASWLQYRRSEAALVRQQATVLRGIATTDATTALIGIIAATGRSLDLLGQPPHEVVYSLAEIVDSPGWVKLRRVDAVNPDDVVAASDSHFYIADATGRIRVVDTRGRTVVERQIGSGRPTSLAAARDAHRVIGVWSNMLQVWDVSGSSLVAEAPLDPPDQWAVSMSPDGQCAAALGSVTGAVKVLDLRTKTLHDVTRDPSTSGHFDRSTPPIVAFSLDNRVAAIIGPNVRPTVFRRSGCALQPIAVLAPSAVVSSNWVLSSDRTMMAAAQGRDIVVYDLPRGVVGRVRAGDQPEATQRFTAVRAARVSVTALALSRQKIVVGRSDGRMMVADLQSTNNAIDIGNPVITPMHSGSIVAVAVDSTSSLVAWVPSGDQAAVRVTSLNDRVTRSLQRHLRDVNTVAFHPKDPLLISGGDDGDVRIWDLARLTRSSNQPGTDVEIGPSVVIAKPADSTRYVTALRFHDSGDVFGLGDDEGGVELWGVTRKANGEGSGFATQNIATLSFGQRGNVESVDVRSDGSRYRIVAVGGRASSFAERFSPFVSGEVSPDSRRDLMEWSVGKAGRGVPSPYPPFEASRLDLLPVFAGYGPFGQLVVTNAAGHIQDLAPAGLTKRTELGSVPARALALSSDGNAVFTAGLDGRLHRYLIPSEIRDGGGEDGETAIRTLASQDQSDQEHAGAVNLVLVSSTGERIYTVGGSGVTAWTSEVEQLESYPLPVAARALVAEPSSRRLAAFGADGTVVATTLPARSSAGDARFPLTAAHLLPMPNISRYTVGARADDPGGRIYVTFNEGTLGSFDRATGGNIGWFRALNDPTQLLCTAPTAAAVGANGLRVFAGCRNGAVITVDQMMEELQYISRPPESGAPTEDAEDSERSVTALALDPRERYVVSLTAKGEATVWPLPTGEPVVFKAHHDDTTAVAVSADGELIATAGVAENRAREVQVWSRSGELKATMNTAGHPPEAAISALVFGGTRWLYAGTAANTIQSWDVRTGARVREIMHDTSVTALAVAPGLIAATGGEGHIKLWDGDGNPLTQALDELPSSEPWRGLLQSACDRMRGVAAIGAERVEDVTAAVDVCTGVVWNESGAAEVHRAVRSGNEQWVRQVVNTRSLAARDDVGRTPLHVAVDVADGLFVEELLRSGADVNAADEYGETPLFSAVRSANMTVLAALLSKGADPNSANAIGDTVLHLAAVRSSADIVRTLIAHGADVNKANAMGVTALMNASAQANVEVVTALLDKTAVNAQDENGSSALFEAARARRVDVVKLLLAGGADVNAQRQNGWERNRTTPLLVARARATDDNADAAYEIEQLIAAKSPLVTAGFPQVTILYSLERNIPQRLSASRTELLEWHDPRTAQARRDELFRKFSGEVNRDPFLQFLVGLAYERGVGVAPNPEHALAWYERSAPSEPLGRIALAMCLWSARPPIRQDMDRVRQLLEDAQPHPLAALYLSQYVEQIDGDLPHSFKIAEAAEGADEPLLHNVLGLKHQLAEGTERDVVKAAELFERAAKGEIGFGMANLGRMHQFGAGRPMSLAEAVRSYHRTVEVDVTSLTGPYFLGVFHSTGTGVPYSEELGRKWFTTCAERGHQTCQVAAGFYAHRTAGIGARPPLEAVRWYRRALFTPGWSQAGNILRSMQLIP